MRRLFWIGILLIGGLCVGAIEAHCSGIKCNVDEKALASSAHKTAIRFRADGLPLKALQELDKAVSLDPQNAIYRAERGNLFLLLHRPEMAMLDYEEWIRIEPKNARAYGEMGVALEMAKSSWRAIEAYSKAITLDKKAEYYYGRASNLKTVADLWSALEDYKEARRLFEAGERTDHPVNPLIYSQIYVDLSSLYFDMGYIEDALEVYKAGSAQLTDNRMQFPFDPKRVRPDTPLQIGSPIPNYEIGTIGGGTLSNRDLLGVPYVLFRWDPVATLTTLYQEWPAGPMDALVFEDDRSIMLDVFSEMNHLGVRLVSVVTRPFGNELESQILKERHRNWPLFELPVGTDSWLGLYDHGRLYRILMVDAEGIIRLALLSQNSEEIRETLLPLLEKIIEQPGYGDMAASTKAILRSDEAVYTR